MQIFPPSEWHFPGPTAAGPLLHEGCLPANSAVGQTDADHQPHGDGQSHRSSAELPHHPRATSQDHVHAAQKGVSQMGIVLKLSEYISIE
jgi:hypothetical protein